ncbi:MAG: HAD family hydrolase [Candidatus Heimdallarchaeaceae archaeon]
MVEKIPIFFDFGGTLVDTLEATKFVFKEALGKNLNNEQIKAMYKDASKKRMSMYMFFKYPVNPIKLFLNRNKMRKMQKEYFLTRIQLQQGVKETIEKISKIEGIELVLLTQNPLMEDEDFSSQILEKLFGKKHPFSKVLAGEDKLELISTNFEGEEIANGLIIGDLPNDVLLGDILKIPCYGVTWGYSEDYELDTPFIVDEFKKLYNMILEHLEDLKEDKAESEEIEEIEFEELKEDNFVFEGEE